MVRNSPETKNSEPEADAESPGGDDGRPRVKTIGFFGRLRAYFLAGVLVTTPLAVTIALATWLIDLVDSRVVPLIPQKYNPDFYLKEYLGYEIGLPGLGLIVLIVFITLVGALTAGFLGRMVLRFYENMLNRMPVIRSVYGATKQILETVLQRQSSAFRQPVLVEYPRRGIWAVAFITGRTEGEVQNLIADDLINVFLPTTPNPTSGFLLFVPREDLIKLDMSVEEAIKMVISAGIVTPPDRRPTQIQETPVTASRETAAERHERSAAANRTEE
ncbi:MAG: DUF502 domain-containing protein [Rhodospirillales bacterium]|nr:MAG: DUF502 domain-containing protein [Rhodospirillales bacterium]